MQPEGTNLCGQTIVAMLGNISIQEAIEIIGKKGNTNTKQIIEALRKIKIKIFSERLLRITPVNPKSKLCIVKLTFEKSNKSHWALWVGKEECFYDPAFKFKIKEEFYRKCGVKESSYLPIGDTKCAAENQG